MRLTPHAIHAIKSAVSAIFVEQKIRDDDYPLLVQLRDRFAGMINS
jgi:hypothetical protein